MLNVEFFSERVFSEVNLKAMSGNRIRARYLKKITSKEYNIRDSRNDVIHEMHLFVYYIVIVQIIWLVLKVPSLDARRT